MRPRNLLKRLNGLLYWNMRKWRRKLFKLFENGESKRQEQYQALSYN